MDSKFIAMKRTITLLEKYGQKLPDMTQKFYAAAPQRYSVAGPGLFGLVYCTLVVIYCDLCITTGGIV